MGHERGKKALCASIARSLLACLIVAEACIVRLARYDDSLTSSAFLLAQSNAKFVVMPFRILNYAH